MTKKSHTTRSKRMSELLNIIREHPSGLSRSEIQNLLKYKVTSKTLYRQLISLVQAGQIERKGTFKHTKYFVNSTADGVSDKKIEIFSDMSKESLKFLETPSNIRETVGYNRDILEKYHPNETFYLPESMRRQLMGKGRRIDVESGAGTYVRLISQRLLIDLSHFSSKLEGNTYSLLDTEKLIEHGHSVEGKSFAETKMILNHKAAIIFLIDNAQQIDINTYTIRSLHGLLSQELIADYKAWGEIRTKEVHIGRSSYNPINNPHVLKELFEKVLTVARKILDPFEQSFFLLLHLAYLQAFEDVNKRTSRLAANIPLIKKNLCPLSFIGVDRKHYTDAILAFYEKNEIRPMLDLYYWAYSRSCQQYEVVKQDFPMLGSLTGQYRQHVYNVMRHVIVKGLHGASIESYAKEYCSTNQILDEKAFYMTLKEMLFNTHEGNVIILNLSVAQLTTWKIDEP